MSAGEWILAMIVNFFRVLVIWRFMRVFFIPKAEKYKEAVSYFLYFVITISVSLLFQNPVYDMGVNLSGLLFLSFLYEGKKRKKIVISVIIYMINMACNVLAVSLFSDFTAGEKPSQVLPIVAVLLIGICEIVAEKLMKEKGRQEVEAPVWILVFVPVVSVFMLHSQVTAKLHNRMLLMVESGGILVINMLFFFVYYQMVTVFERQMKQEHIVQQMKLYENQLEVMRQSEYKVYALRHDMKHHLQDIYVMTQKGEKENVLRYLERMQNALENPGEYVATGNQEIDSILNYMLAKAEQAGINVEQKIKVSKKIAIEAYELNSILGNLLENAITASKESSEKYLSIHIVENKGMLMLRIKNSYSGKIVTSGGMPVSTKGGTEHGYGLVNVKNMVKKHQGTMNVVYDEREFRVEIILYL